MVHLLTKYKLHIVTRKNKLEVIRQVLASTQVKKWLGSLICFPKNENNGDYLMGYFLKSKCNISDMFVFQPLVPCL